MSVGESKRKLIMLLYPESLLKDTVWGEVWAARELQSLKNINTIAFAIACLLYVVHGLFVDPKLNLIDDHWLYYRYGIALFCLVSIVLIRYAKSTFFVRAIILVTSAMICYWQARSMVWYSGVPYFWGILFALIGGHLLKSSSFISSVAVSLFCYLQLGSFSEAGIPMPLTLGGLLVPPLVTLFLRRSYSDEIQLFYEQKKNEEASKQIVELQTNLSDQIQAFLPRVIRERLLECVTNNKVSVLQATDEVLRLRKKEISCLFTDIRGFTKSSKESGFLDKNVVPNIKGIIGSIENQGGIPRIIGDLIFAYYDDQNLNKNIIASFVSAYESSKITIKANANSDHRICRYTLLSSGEAHVGNIGGIEGAREVTALGSCVNLLARIDELTKHMKLRQELGEIAIIMTSEFTSKILEIWPDFPMKEIDLSAQNFKIRDFEDISKLFYIDEKNINSINLITAQDSHDKVLKGAA